MLVYAGKSSQMCTAHRHADKGALWHCSPSPLQQKTKLKHYLRNAGIIDMVIPNVLHDLPFENKVKNSERLRKNLKKTRLDIVI